MKRWLTPLIVAASLLLGGCASVLQSNVTAFHAWPADSAGKSFAFVPAKQQQGNLEYDAYAQLIRRQLLGLGLREAPEPQHAQLNVTFRYGMTTEQIVETRAAYDPFFYGPPPGWGRFGPYGFYGPFGPAYYDPFWGDGPLQSVSYPVFMRRLQIGITNAADGKQLYDVTVDSDGRQAGLAAAMPYMVRAAFQDFPGPSGVTRQLSVKIDKDGGYRATAADGR